MFFTSAWERVRLDEVCTTTSGGTPSRDVRAYYEDGTIPWVKSGELRDGPVSQVDEYISELGVKNSSAKVFPAGTLLIAIYGATVGRLGILQEDAATNQAVCAIFTGKRVFQHYLFFYLLSIRDSLIESRSGGAQPNISQEIIRNLEIPLPPLPEQQRIAGILSRADRLRRLRRYALEMSDGYLQSVFLEMFGDPATNPMGWEISQVGHLAEVKTGGTPSRELASFYGGSIPWVKTTEVVGSTIRSTSETLTESGLSASNCEVFPIDTIVVAMYGQGLTRGRSGLLGIAAATNQACAAILPSHKIETSYLWAYIKVSYNRLRDLGRGGNQPNLNLSMIRDFPVPLPPEGKRKAFVEIMRNHERLRAQQSEALRQAEHLFQTLLHGAFRGEG